MQDSDLDGIFAAARAAAPLPSAALMARIEADALREQALRARPQPAPRRPSLMQRLLAALGGPQMAAGLATATLVGLWVGWIEPAPLTGLTDQWGDSLAGEMTLDRVELIPALDPFAPAADAAEG